MTGADFLRRLRRIGRKREIAGAVVCSLRQVPSPGGAEAVHRQSYRAAIAALALGLTACAGSTQSYQPPSGVTVWTERRVPFPFDVAWDRYVSELSKSFFVINNISKDSRIINLSFSTSNPSKYIDCGTTTRTSTHPATGEQVFQYITADSSQYNAGITGTNEFWSVTRSARLDGRVNVYIAADQIPISLLRVNAKYVWTVNISAVSNLGAPHFELLIVDFTSTVGGSRADRDPVTCISKGVLEKELLDLI